jgi:hypothetical protein
MRKDDIYEMEQKEILIKLLKEIGLTPYKLSIERSELEKEIIKDKIRGMKDEIWKYYKTSGWNSCKYGKNPELNIIKNICKHHNIKIYKVEKKKKEGDKLKGYKIYDFNINDKIKEELL